MTLSFLKAKIIEAKVAIAALASGDRPKVFKISSKTQTKLRPKSVTFSQIFQNWISHCIEVIFCLSLLGAFQKLADKDGMCKFALMLFNFDKKP